MKSHTSEIITDLKKIPLSTGLVLQFLIMLLLLLLLLLLRTFLSFWKRGSLLGYIWVLHITENLQIGATVITEKTKNHWLFWAKNCQGRVYSRKLVGQCLNLCQESKTLMFDVFMKKLIRAATGLVGSILFHRERIAFSEGKIGNL